MANTFNFVTDHEANINRLIPHADRLARQRVNDYGRVSEERQYTDWNGTLIDYTHNFHCQFFHEEMNKLTVEAGLRSL